METGSSVGIQATLFLFCSEKGSSLFGAEDGIGHGGWAVALDSME